MVAMATKTGCPQHRIAPHRSFAQSRRVRSVPTQSVYQPAEHPHNRTATADAVFEAAMLYWLMLLAPSLARTAIKSRCPASPTIASSCQNKSKKTLNQGETDDSNEHELHHRRHRGRAVMRCALFARAPCRSVPRVSPLTVLRVKVGQARTRPTRYPKSALGRSTHCSDSGNDTAICAAH